MFRLICRHASRMSRPSSAHSCLGDQRRQPAECCRDLPMGISNKPASRARASSCVNCAEAVCRRPWSTRCRASFPAGQATQVRRQLVRVPGFNATAMACCEPQTQIGVRHFIRVAAQQLGDRVAGDKYRQAHRGPLSSSDLRNHRTQRHAASNAFAQQDRVRFDAQAPNASRWLVRPKPDWISSAISTMRAHRHAKTSAPGRTRHPGPGNPLRPARFDDKAGHVLDVDLDAEQALHGLEASTQITPLSRLGNGR